MASSDYHFLSRWRVLGTAEEVSEVFGKPEDLARWWPSVYLETEVLTPGDERGLGRTVRVLTKGFLPYTLGWRFRVVESRRPHGLSIEAEGDFVGRGIWSFEQNGTWVDVSFDWRISVEKPGIKHLSPFLKPLFAANHRWAMRRGEESLKLELTRRRCLATRAALPEAPPGPTTSSVLPWLAGAAAVAFVVIALTGWLLQPRRRRRRWSKRSCR